MSEYLIQDATMQAIADPIKIMSGIEDKITPTQIGTAAEEANTEIGTQADLMEQIMTALEGKAGGSTTIPDGYMDTSGMTATAADMAEGVTAGVNGEIITGEIPVESSVLVTSGSSSVSYVSSSTSPYISGRGTITGPKILKNSSVTVNIAGSKLGDATTEDVVAGKTFTSANGLLLTGEHECAAGLDTSDATATAADIALDKTAYVNGIKLTGTGTLLTSGTIAKGVAVSDVSIGTFYSSSSLKVSYYSSISVSDGAITGTSAGNVNFDSSSDTGLIDSLKGYYIQVSNNFYYVPDTATCTISGTYSYTVKFSGINPMFILA